MVTWHDSSRIFSGFNHTKCHIRGEFKEYYCMVYPGLL